MKAMHGYYPLHAAAQVIEIYLIYIIILREFYQNLFKIRYAKIIDYLII
jgi:hypothetical protein